MATLKVNLSEVGNACEQDPTPAGHFPNPGWYVFLADCQGNPVVRAGKEYGPFPVNHGYVEIPDVPPGRYLLFGMVNPFPVTKLIPGGEVIFQSNFASHFAIIDVCCGCHDYCVTLYNSGWHYCVHVIVFWFELLMAHEQMAPELGRNAINALNAALETSKALPTDAAVVRQLGNIVDRFQRKAG